MTPLNPVDAWWRTCLRRGGQLGPGIWRERIPMCEFSAVVVRETGHKWSTGTAPVPGLRTELWTSGPSYIFPPLAVCREAFIKAFGPIE